MEKSPLWASVSASINSVQLFSRGWLFATPWTIAHQASLYITNSQSLLKLMSIKSVVPSNHLVLCRPLLLLQSLPASGSFPDEWVLHIRWPTCWSFSFSISPSNEYSELISYRIDWFDFLAVQGTLQEPSATTQFKSINSSVLSFLYSSTLTSIHDVRNHTTGKTIALTRWTFVGKVMSLLFNMLSMLVIAFLPRSKHLLISWLQSPSAVILEPRKIKVSRCFHCFPIYLPWSDGTSCLDLSFLNVEF